MKQRWTIGLVWALFVAVLALSAQPQQGTSSVSDANQLPVIKDPTVIPQDIEEAFDAFQPADSGSKDGVQNRAIARRTTRRRRSSG